MRSYTVYTSGIEMKIDRASDGQRLFEGEAQAARGQDAHVEQRRVDRGHVQRQPAGCRDRRVVYTNAAVGL